MRPLFKALIIRKNRYISHVYKVDSSHGGILGSHLYHIIFIGTAQGTGAEGNSVMLIVHQL